MYMKRYLLGAAHSPDPLASMPAALALELTEDLLARMARLRAGARILERDGEPVTVEVGAPVLGMEATVAVNAQSGVTEGLDEDGAWPLSEGRNVSGGLSMGGAGFVVSDPRVEASVQEHEPERAALQVETERFYLCARDDQTRIPYYAGPFSFAGLEQALGRTLEDATDFGAGSD